MKTDRRSWLDALYRPQTWTFRPFPSFKAAPQLYVVGAAIIALLVGHFIYLEMSKAPTDADTAKASSSASLETKN